MKTTTEMAREAGGVDITSKGWTSWVGTQSTEFLERLAALVRADERDWLLGYIQEHQPSNKQIVDAIQARGNK